MNSKPTTDSAKGIGKIPYRMAFAGVD